MKLPPAQASGAILIEKSTKAVSPTIFVTLYMLLIAARARIGQRAALSGGRSRSDSAVDIRPRRQAHRAGRHHLRRQLYQLGCDRGIPTKRMQCISRRSASYIF